MAAAKLVKKAARNFVERMSNSDEPLSSDKLTSSVPAKLIDSEIDSVSRFVEEFKTYKADGGQKEMKSLIVVGLLTVFCYDQLETSVEDCTDDDIFKYLDSLVSSSQRIEPTWSNLDAHVKINNTLVTSNAFLFNES